MKTEINFIDQNRLMLDDEKSVFEEVGEGQENVRLGDETIGLRAYLRRFLFTEERINTKINLLSGGERSRVMLAKILKRGGNVLVLDEPTNDLDLNTLRLLEEALLAFRGSVIVVSHDRYFLNRVCTDIFAFEGNGIVDYQVGNYDYYLEKKAARVATEASYQATAKKAKPKLRKERPRKLKWAELKKKFLSYTLAGRNLRLLRRHPKHKFFVKNKYCVNILSHGNARTSPRSRITNQYH